MKLYTECFWEGWDRIVDIYPDRCESIPEYINDDQTYKIILLEKGALELRNDKGKLEVKAPVLIGLSQKNQVEYRVIKPISSCILFFKPSVIRDEFSFERIDSGEFENMMGRSIYQDYLLVKYFKVSSDIKDHILALPMNGLTRLKELFTLTEKELKGQKDGYWPCRSRSYLMEMLHFVLYSYIAVTPEFDDPDREEFSKICEYLNEHISEQITLEMLTRHFAMNRNKLNDIFLEHSSMTCLNYLMNLRIDLAKILLKRTELPISEISNRVGYPDSNYFSKLFRNMVGKTPSKYRKS